MSMVGLKGRHPRPYRKTTTHSPAGRYAPDLIKQDFTATNPGEKLCGDITYIKTWDGWAYLATVIDLHNREVIGWALADHMRTELIMEAMNMAIKHGAVNPRAIFHSDRGSVYASDAFAAYCKKRNIRRSMGRTGTCYDNAVAESFFATYKKELIHTRPWPTIRHLRRATFEWIETYYNRTRRHSTLNYLTPAEYRLGYRTLTEIHRLAA
jgi:transposase InsO family protein